MATTNQRNRSNGRKGSHGGRGKVQETASQAAEKLTHMRDEVSDYLSRGTEHLGQMTRGHEGQAMLVALAAGFGIGFVIGCTMVSANRRPRTWGNRIAAEGLGRKLLDRIERALPEAITEHFGK
jgi:hypothetical protein